VYESVKAGSGHHMKFRPPKALILLVGVVALISFFGYRFYSNRIAPTQPVEESAQIRPGQTSDVESSGFITEGQPMTTAQYVESTIPRLPDVPSSAPIYDRITQAVSYPKAFCVSTRDEGLIKRASAKMTLGYVGDRLTGCRCNTQQGTKVDMSFNACIARVDHGAFDPAIPDRQSIHQEKAGEAGEERAAAPAVDSSLASLNF